MLRFLNLLIFEAQIEMMNLIFEETREWKLCGFINILAFGVVYSTILELLGRSRPMKH